MTTGALQGLLYCGNILIPSLFPFMVLSTFIVKCGLADALGRFLSPITKRLFHTNGCVGAVILLGMTGGFPVGARGITALYDERKTDLKTAQALSMFLVGGGPGFVIFVVGTTLYNDTLTGLLLWLSQAAAQIILGVYSCRKLTYTQPNSTNIQRQPLCNTIVESTQIGVNGMLSLCGLVIIFSCVFGILEDIHLTEILSQILCSVGIPQGISKSILSILWEVTKGCSTCCDNAVPIWFTAFALGWSGICVHFQVYSVVTALNISKIKFTLYRLAQGVISAVITAVIFFFYTPAHGVYSSTLPQHSQQLSSSLAGSVSLIILCIIFSVSVSTKSRRKF